MAYLNAYPKSYFYLKRIFDIILSIFFLIVLLPVVIFLFILIYVFDGGKFIHWSKRIGQNNNIFLMPKIRTMQLSTPDVATHLLKKEDIYITKIGKILRKTSLDEIPQLYSILKGDMSFVGPRPALFNQFDLINLRTKKKIHLLIPGITGLAQINGRDLLSINEKVLYDYEYLIKRSFFFDIKIIIITIVKIFTSKEITH
tara:strand:+ start:631 stop:1230 length:600 start_codon:yes stop_codon:yes gene_type:complete